MFCNINLPVVSVDYKPFELTDEQIQALKVLGDHNINYILDCNYFIVTGLTICGPDFEFKYDGSLIPYKKYLNPNNGTQPFLIPNPVPPVDCKIEYDAFPVDEYGRFRYGFYLFTSKKTEA